MGYWPYTKRKRNRISSFVWWTHYSLMSECICVLACMFLCVCVKCVSVWLPYGEFNSLVLYGITFFIPVISASLRLYLLSVSSFLFSFFFLSRSLYVRLSSVCLYMCLCVRANMTIYSMLCDSCAIFFSTLCIFAILPDALPSHTRWLLSWQNFKVNSCKYLKLLEHIRALQANIFTLMHVRYNYSSKV